MNSHIRRLRESSCTYENWATSRIKTCYQIWYKNYFLYLIRHNGIKIRHSTGQPCHCSFSDPNLAFFQHDPNLSFSYLIDQTLHSQQILIRIVSAGRINSCITVRHPYLRLEQPGGPKSSIKQFSDPNLSAKFAVAPTRVFTFWANYPFFSNKSRRRSCVFHIARHSSISCFFSSGLTYEITKKTHLNRRCPPCFSDPNHSKRSRGIATLCFYDQECVSLLVWFILMLYRIKVVSQHFLMNYPGYK